MTEIHGNQEDKVYIDTLFIGSIAEKVNQPTVSIKLNDSAWETRFKIETGTEANGIPNLSMRGLNPDHN